MIRPRLLPLAALLLATAFAPALAATAAAPAKQATAAAASHPAAAVSDGAPFWTGKPTAAVFAARQKSRIRLAKLAIARMLAARAPRTIKNTLVPYDEALRQLDMAGNQANLMSECSPNKPTRDAAEKMTQVISAYGTELSLNRQVYDALAALELSGADADAETKFYVTRTLRDFRLSGVDKDDSTRARIRRLNDELVTIGQGFDRNIREDTSSVTCMAAELEGLPVDYIAGHKPGPAGTIRLTIDYPDALPVFQYAKSGELRRRMYMAYSNRAYPANIAALDRLRAKRHELAQLLGFTNFADLVTADKMVGSARNARDFVDRVVAASGDRAQREYLQLLAEKKKADPSATAVNFWEAAYIREQVRKSSYNFDSQSIRPYLPYDRVESGVLDIAGKLFGVEYRRVPNAPVWDPSVKCYEMWDGGRLAGRFYLDMHPRANKFNHAAEFDIRTGLEGRQIPEVALLCNLAGGKKGDPGLCDYEDVDTFFHEFGHLMHSMFAGHHRWIGIGGIKTEQDFVEAPSQMLEEWMRDPGVLAAFAKHYQTNEPIPAELVRQMNHANDFGKGLDVRRQMVYAATSLGCFDRDPAGLTTDSLTRGLVRKYQPFPVVDGTHFQCAFGHLNGYSAIYYTYMWSLVIAKDMFAQFDRDHLLAPGVATRYREAVLAPGGSKPARDLVADFLGRPFNEQAWKKWLDTDD